MTDYEQAYRDLRAGVEALTLQLSNRYARLCMQAQGEEEFADDDAVEADTLSRELNSLRALLASSAPATAWDLHADLSAQVNDWDERAPRWVIARLRSILAAHTPPSATEPIHDDDCDSRGCTHCEVCGAGVLYGSRCSAHPVPGSSGAVAVAAAASKGAKEPDHEFLPVNGHPDDDECTHRADGTDATYCGKTRAEHDEPEHHPNCYQSTGEIPADLPDDLCDCRVLRMIDAATGVTSSDGARGLSEEIERTLSDHFVRWASRGDSSIIEGGPAGEWRCSCGKKFGFSTTATKHQAEEVASILAARTAQSEGVERVECDHPGIEHGPFSATGICPKCRNCKFIGHGPLCVDCFAPVSAEEVVGDE